MGKEKRRVPPPRRALETCGDAIEQIEYVRVEMLPIHLARDMRRGKRAAEGARERSPLGEQRLGVELPQRGLVVKRRKMPLHEAGLAGILPRNARGPQDRVGDEQIALDMAPPPGEELKPRLGEVRRRKGGGAPVAIQHAKAPGGRAFRSNRAKVVRGAGGLAAAENHCGLHERARQLGRHAPRPGAQNLAIAWPLDIEHEPAGRSLFAACAGSLGRQHVVSPSKT